MCEFQKHPSFYWVNHPTQEPVPYFQIPIMLASQTPTHSHSKSPLKFNRDQARLLLGKHDEDIQFIQDDDEKVSLHEIDKRLHVLEKSQKRKFEKLEQDISTLAENDEVFKKFIRENGSLLDSRLALVENDLRNLEHRVLNTDMTQIAQNEVEKCKNEYQELILEQMKQHKLQLEELEQIVFKQSEIIKQLQSNNNNNNNNNISQSTSETQHLQETVILNRIEDVITVGYVAQILREEFSANLENDAGPYAIVPQIKFIGLLHEKLQPTAAGKSDILDHLKKLIPELRCIKKFKKVHLSMPRSVFDNDLM